MCNRYQYSLSGLDIWFRCAVDVSKGGRTTVHRVQRHSLLVERCRTWPLVRAITSTCDVSESPNDSFIGILLIMCKLRSTDSVRWDEYICHMTSVRARARSPCASARE